MAAPFDSYLADQTPAFREALIALADRIEARLPTGAERVISYAMPGWRVPAPKGTKVAAGMAGFTHHLGFYPHSGSVVPHIAERLDADGFKHSRSGVLFTPDRPLPDWVLDEVIGRRLAEIG